MASTLPDDLEIALGFTVADWKALNLEPETPKSKDWGTALEIFRARIEGRFFDPVDLLIREHRNDKTVYGFAVLAIDFLVMETLQIFREGKIDKKNPSETLIKDFLKRWHPFTAHLTEKSKSEDYAKAIYKGYRCALHHSGSTDGAFLVRAYGPVFDFKSVNEITINRTQFHQELKREFEAYLHELGASDNNDLRSKFKRKMDAICGLA